MALNDPYSAIRKSLPLMDLMHRFLLPGIVRDMAAFMKSYGMRRVLDVACGTGYTACALHRRGLQVTGIDISPAMLERAAARTGGCTFLRADGAALPFRDCSFDAAHVALAVHEMAPHVRTSVLAQMKRVVRPSGVLFIVDFADLPARASLTSRAVAGAILAVEKGTVSFDPDHWTNSLDFQETGGLAGWLAAAGEAPERTWDYLGGNIVMAAVVNGARTPLPPP